MIGGAARSVERGGPVAPSEETETPVSEASHGQLRDATWLSQNRARRARARGEGEAFRTMASALAPAAPVPPAVARFPRREGRRRATRAPVASSASARVDTDADVIANHERILGTRDAPKDTVLMFSYGANINPYTLNRRGIGPSASAVARAPGRRLVFIHRGGYASLEEAVDEDAKTAGLGERTRGALGTVHRISKTELAAVRRWEIGYEMREIDVVVADPPGYRAGDEDEDEDGDGDGEEHGVGSGGGGDDAREEDEGAAEDDLAPGERRVRATVFLTKRTARLKTPVVPFAEYVAKIVDGAESMRLDEGYVAELRALASKAPASNERGREYFDIAAEWSEDYGFGFGAMFKRK